MVAFVAPLIAAGATAYAAHRQGEAAREAAEAGIEATEFKPWDVLAPGVHADFKPNDTMRLQLSPEYTETRDALRNIANQAFGINPITGRRDIRQGMRAGDIEGVINLSGIQNRARNREQLSQLLGFDVNRRLFDRMAEAGLIQRGQRGPAPTTIDLSDPTAQTLVQGARPNVQTVEQVARDLGLPIGAGGAEGSAAMSEANRVVRNQQAARDEWDAAYEAATAAAAEVDPKTGRAARGPREVGGELRRATGPRSVEEIQDARFREIMDLVGFDRDRDQARLFDQMNRMGIMGTTAGERAVGEFGREQRRQELAAVQQAFQEGLQGAGFEWNRGMEALRGAQGIDASVLDAAQLGMAAGGRQAAAGAQQAQMLSQLGNLDPGALWGSALAGAAGTFGQYAQDNPGAIRDFWGRITQPNNPYANRGPSGMI